MMMLPSAWRPTRTIFTAAKVNAVNVSARIVALQIRWNRRFDEVRLSSFEIILSPRAAPQSTAFAFARGQFCANSVLTNLIGRAVTWILLTCSAVSGLSAGRAKPGQCDCDEPPNRRFGRQIAGCTQGVEAITRELRRRDIVPNVAGLCTLGQQLPDELL